MNIHELIKREASERLGGDLGRIAIFEQSTDRELSYAELFKGVEELARKLSAHGVGPLKRVGLVLDNSPGYVTISLAVLSLDAAIVPLSPEHTTGEVEEAMKRLGVSHIIYGAEGPFKGTANDIELAEGIRLSITGNGAMPLSEGYEEIRPAFIRFSSGTTGQSKGVVLSHVDIDERTTAADAGLGITRADNVLWLLSMSFHFVVTILLFLRRGAGIIICSEPLSEAVMRATAEQGGTFMYAAPYHYDMLASDADVPSDALKNLRMAVSTTLRLSPAIAERFVKKFGFRLTEAYGIIEVGLPFVGVSSSAGGDLGKVLPAYEIKIDSPDDEGVGEILLKGPGMFSAYLEPWSLRADVLRDGGWFATGDMGRLGPSGELSIVGRRKSMINFSGMKVFPYEVEEVINSFPGVRESLVYPEAHDRYGQLPMAKVVSLDPASPPDMRALRRYCYDRMAQYKVPKGFELQDEPLPRTKSGKIVRS